MINKLMIRKIKICDIIALSMIMAIPVSIGINIGMENYTKMIIWIVLYIIGLLYLTSENGKIQNAIYCDKLINESEKVKGRFD
jgi:hypothetical protein